MNNYTLIYSNNNKNWLVMVSGIINSHSHQTNLFPVIICSGCFDYDQTASLSITIQIYNLMTLINTILNLIAILNKKMLTEKL